MDVADIQLDTRKTVVRPVHARSVCKVYRFFATPRGKMIIANGWRAAGITNAVQDGRATVPDLLGPFAALSILMKVSE